jgi:hypothetical protein
VLSKEFQGQVLLDLKRIFFDLGMFGIGLTFLLGVTQGPGSVRVLVQLIAVLLGSR